jgi:hypothetical protein
VGSRAKVGALSSAARGRGPHSECELISIKIDPVKVVQAVIEVLRWLYDPGSARRQFGVDGIDIPYEHADAAIAG